jgi:hypothetical protein
MANVSSKTTTPAPAPAAPFSKQIGKFTFTAVRGVVIPEVIPTATRDSLPFPEFFEGAQHNDYFFVGTSYWTSPKADGGRGRTAAETPLKWQKDKIKGAMNDWRKKDLKGREDHAVVCIERKKGDLLDSNNPKAGVYEEDGIGFWVQIVAKVPATPPAE